MVDQTSEKIQKEEIPEKEQIAKYLKGKNEESLEEFLNQIKNLKGIYAGEFEIIFGNKPLLNQTFKIRKLSKKKLTSFNQI